MSEEYSTIRMSDSEIIYRWNNKALTDYQMVKCLAELNACERGVMADKLERLGLISSSELKRAKRSVRFNCTDFSDRETAILIDMKSRGFSYRDISMKLHRSVSSIGREYSRLRAKGVIT